MNKVSRTEKSGEVCGLSEIVEDMPSYWQEACHYLIERDRVMHKLVVQYGPARLRSPGSAFMRLARFIVGQQISIKAAQSVWARLLRALAVESATQIQPKHILSQTIDELRAAGLSLRKVEYLQDLAHHFVAGKLQESDLLNMDDQAIVDQLVLIRGVGRWTAEMFLIFHLGRPDILPLDDVGLLKAISVNYFSGEPVSRAEARDIAGAWVPYRSVATWYLWRSLDPIPVEY